MEFKYLLIYILLFIITKYYKKIFNKNIIVIGVLRGRNMQNLFLVILLSLLNLKTALAADFIVGLKAFKAQDYDTAFEEFFSLAETGDIRAQTYIGMMYFNGLSVSKNFETAAEWYIKAAELGHPHAQYYLGWMYDNGKGVEENKKLAFKWLQTSAKQGHPRAQNNVGVMYFKGEGVQKNLLLAQMWYMISASKGMQEAIENMNTLKGNLTDKEISLIKQMVKNCMVSNYQTCEK